MGEIRISSVLTDSSASIVRATNLLCNYDLAFNEVSKKLFNLRDKSETAIFSISDTDEPLVRKELQELGFVCNFCFAHDKFCVDVCDECEQTQDNGDRENLGEE